MFDLIINPMFFLKKNKLFVESFLQKNNIECVFFPEEQKEYGWDVIECENVQFWFTCDESVYLIYIDLLYNKKNVLEVFFDDKKLSKEKTTSDYLDFLNKTGKKFSEYSYTDDDGNTFDVISFFIQKKIMVMVTLYKDSAHQLTIKYDGYGEYQYKKGVSLNDWLHHYN